MHAFRNRLACFGCGKSVIGAWRDGLDRILVEAEISAWRCYLSTPCDDLPWLEYRVSKAGKHDERGKIADFDFRLVSREKTRFLAIAIHHEMHQIGAYWCKRGRPRPP